MVGPNPAVVTEFSRVFSRPLPLIGMIHLAALPGYPPHPGMPELIRRALLDLTTLEAAGFDGVLVENDNDQPHQIGVSPKISDAFAETMRAAGATKAPSSELRSSPATSSITGRPPSWSRSSRE